MSPYWCNTRRKWAQDVDASKVPLKANSKRHIYLVTICI
ncbi:hypothetical protein AKJ16_DCAP13512 [Drosera capensis]